MCLSLIKQSTVNSFEALYDSVAHGLASQLSYSTGQPHLLGGKMCKRWDETGQQISQQQRLLLFVKLIKHCLLHDIKRIYGKTLSATWDKHNCQYKVKYLFTALDLWENVAFGGGASAV